MTGVDEMNIYDIYTDICTNGFCAPDTENPTYDDKVDKDDLRGVRFETQFALACANMKSAITTMEDSYGLELFARNEAQRAINRINRVTGRL